MPGPNRLLDSSIEYLKGVGPQRGETLKKELGIFTFNQLLWHLPFRYIDRTRFHRIAEAKRLEEPGFIQIRGVLRRADTEGEGRRKRLTAVIADDSGSLELIWFQGIHFVQRYLVPGKEYIVFGRLSVNKYGAQMAHPEMEAVVSGQLETGKIGFDPVYSTTEKLSSAGLDAAGLRKLLRTLLDQLRPDDVPEVLPEYLVQHLKAPSRYQALISIHFPVDQPSLQAAQLRLKFEELFLLQMRLLRLKKHRQDTVRGFSFGLIGEHFNEFFHNKLPFQLTEAQKRVLREIRKDLGAGIQMNRLLQGDVGSGKTVVALMTVLIALDNGFQACLMAPTEILAQQHYLGITELLQEMGPKVAFLSGSVKGKQRTQILDELREGTIDLVIGTHALIEDTVNFKKLGLVVIDEQHRFGVEQRAKLWKKSTPYPPHVLVMTATPIPRTLAMTLYGDLDVSVIDELPPGRKPIATQHKFESQRLRVLGIIREEIAKGRQVYIVYPMIEESETLDMANLMKGYEAVQKEFPAPEYQISVVHGKMKAADKDLEMQRFVRGETQIMVATTVIEVGVNVPNASVMVIENTERFGLSQLHQLRGRVGRGAEQSFCILMTGNKLTQEAKERVETMVRTQNGFEIAEADLRLRGPGDLEGTQQSGLLQLRIANLAQDQRILQTAREFALRILEQDPSLIRTEHQSLRKELASKDEVVKGWSRIS